MANPKYDLEGWAEIGAHVGRALRACQKYARRGDDPLPVFNFLGRTVANRAELDAWLNRQAQPRPPRAPRRRGGAE